MLDSKSTECFAMTLRKLHGGARCVHCDTAIKRILGHRRFSDMPDDKRDEVLAESECRRLVWLESLEADHKLSKPK